MEAVNRAKVGVDEDLEAQADELIRKSLVGVHSQGAKRDILTAWKLKDRMSREVLVPTPDRAVHQGTFTRSRPKGGPIGKTDSREGVAGLVPQRHRPLLAEMVYQGQNINRPSVEQHCEEPHSNHKSCRNGCAESWNNLRERWWEVQ